MTARQSDQTSPRNYPGSCSQREPNGPKAVDVRNTNLRCVVCGSLARVSIQKGLITQRSLVQIQPRNHTQTPETKNGFGGFVSLLTYYLRSALCSFCVRSH